MAADRDASPTLIVACPTCRKSVPWVPDSSWRPFCSERCKLIDLGAWAEGRHHIPGDVDHGDGMDDPGDV